jgi:hypothetical protein
MKKNYVSPLANEVNVTTEGLIAASLQMNNTAVDSKKEGVQLGNENRGQWGNLWGK